MTSLSGMDWLRALICIFFIEGAIYLFFPKAIQGYAVRVLCDASLRKLQLFGILLLIIGFILWVIVSNSSAGYTLSS